MSLFSVPGKTTAVTGAVFPSPLGSAQPQNSGRQLCLERPGLSPAREAGEKTGPGPSVDFRFRAGCFSASGPGLRLGLG